MRKGDPTLRSPLPDSERATQWALALGPKLMALTCNRYRRDRARPHDAPNA
jgi:hypothetical protein